MIVTEDDEITSQIIQGTNRQTEVKIEAFESVRTFQKELEEFYGAASRSLPELLFYERRSKQYDYVEVKRDRIVSLASQIQCFLAMFLNEPHSHARYYGELLSAYRGRLFVENHRPHPYFVAGASLAAIERQLSTGALPREWKPFKYQILMAYRISMAGAELPPLSHPRIEAYCQTLLNNLSDPVAATKALQQAGEVVAKAFRDLAPSREPAQRTRALTERMVALLGKPLPPFNAGNRVRGKLRTYSDILQYGFLVLDDNTKVYLASRELIAQPKGRSPKIGDVLEFDMVPSSRGPRAIAVSFID